MTYFRSINSYFQDYKSEMLSLFNILHGQTENNLKQCAKEHINTNTNNQTSNFAEYINKKYIRFQPKIEDMKFTKKLENQP